MTEYPARFYFHEYWGGEVGDDCNDPKPTIAKCWNCGGHVFDEDGQCLYCFEPNVIESVVEENPEQLEK